MKLYVGVDVKIHVFLTSALVGGEWSASPSGKEPLLPIGHEAEWAPEPVWMTHGGEKSCLYRDTNSDPSAVLPQPIAKPIAIPRLHIF
jgi:hypothetical protein